jgi:hypothetical protein
MVPYEHHAFLALTAENAAKVVVLEQYVQKIAARRDSGKLAISPSFSSSFMVVLLFLSVALAYPIIYDE